ncbi:hypothetical protein [Schleiferilactobacillus perolens]|uniref:Uncharacterized protein n=1 Tax=Schleiferilactobacillus perolens DSM 12744 TaxID=1423792 RepID=A0A0R1N054_9LACO|nr:hypothetical protein [Schleiferilactobacillus perolens]KRL10730.1 hypothetical protein FD09_GL000873 [Schleiferilactobacillus perolens DSM 12744]
MSNVINLDDVLATKQDLTYKGKTYTFEFSDKMQQALNDTWVKANAYANQLTDEEKNGSKTADIDHKPVEQQLEYVRGALAKQHEIIMEFFDQTIGENKANQLYNDLNQSTNGLMFVLGLVKRAADKAIKDAETAEYPAFDGNEDND